MVLDWRKMRGVVSEEMLVLLTLPDPPPDFQATREIVTALTIYNAAYALQDENLRREVQAKMSEQIVLHAQLLGQLASPTLELA